MIEHIISLLKQEFQMHPKAKLVDYYKLLYQSVFGPEHFIANEEKAWHFFQREWEENVVSQPLKIQEISLFQPMYRMYFGIDATLRKEDVFSAFLLSAKTRSEYTWDDWKHVWFSAEDFLKTMVPFCKDETNTTKTLLETHEIPSHSDVFKTTYTPHYRICNKAGYEFLTEKAAHEK